MDFGGVWDAYDSGQPYIDKYDSMRVHVIRIRLTHQPARLPLFNHESVFKTIKGYFHELKRLCLSEDEYFSAGPLFIYSVERESGMWTFLGELRQLLLLGTTLADEKMSGEKLVNMDKRIEFMKKHFGDAVSPKDFQMFMKAKTPRQLEKALQRLVEQGIERIEISSKSFEGNIEETKATLVDIKGLLEEADNEQ